MILKKTLIACIAVLAPALAMAQTMQKYEIDVKDFNQLSVEDGFNVVYTSDDNAAGKATFTTTKEISDKIIFENNGKGKLTIQKAFHDEGDMRDGLPTIYVSSRFLKNVSNSGDSTVRVTAIRPTMEIKAVVIGNGRLVVRDIDCSKFYGSIQTGNGTLVAIGKCDEATLSNTGTGSIQADNLEAKNVSARFFGTGTTGCYATGVLSVKGVMKGKLYYRGKPERIRNFSVGVKIYNLEGTEWTGEAEKEADKEAAEAPGE